ncbi:MAG: phosphoglycerate kinase [Gemmatimonadota bacterium]
MRRRTIRDLKPQELAGRRALVRVDYNVPLGPAGAVADATRVEATLPTLRRLLEAGAKPVLLSHMGRPRGAVRPDLSLAPVAPILEGLLETPVEFGGLPDSSEALERSRGGPGRVLLLENTRFLPGETRNDDGLAARLAALGDLFVSDAFGSAHRAHASVVGVTRHLRPAVAGLLVEAELEALGALLAAPATPFVVAFGGAKMSDKIRLLERCLETADRVLIGGAMANTFLRARGVSMAASVVEEEAVGLAGDLLARFGRRLRLPSDLVVANPAEPGTERVVEGADVPDGMSALDIGPATAAAFAEIVRDAGTLFWNGPMGWFENETFAAGTRTLAQAAADATRRGAFTVIGGGDSASAVRGAGLMDAVSHVSTGGGAALEFLAQGTLPGLEALDEA